MPSIDPFNPNYAPRPPDVAPLRETHRDTHRMVTKTKASLHRSFPEFDTHLAEKRDQWAQMGITVTEAPDGSLTTRPQVDASGATMGLPERRDVSRSQTLRERVRPQTDPIADCGFVLPWAGEATEAQDDKDIDYWADMAKKGQESRKVDRSIDVRRRRFDKAILEEKSRRDVDAASDGNAMKRAAGRKDADKVRVPPGRVSSSTRTLRPGSQQRQALANVHLSFLSPSDDSSFFLSLFLYFSLPPLSLLLSSALLIPRYTGGRRGGH
jgi:hypothetical protein